MPSLYFENPPKQVQQCREYETAFEYNMYSSEDDWNFTVLSDYSSSGNESEKNADVTLTIPNIRFGEVSST